MSCTSDRDMSKGVKYAMDKVVIKFFADVLYLNNVLCFEEYEDIMECKEPCDLDMVFDKMIKEEYNAYKRGYATT